MKAIGQTNGINDMDMKSWDGFLKSKVDFTKRTPQTKETIIYGEVRTNV